MKWQVLLDGHPVDVDSQFVETVKEVEPGVYSILLDGRCYEVRATKKPDGLQVETLGMSFNAEVRDPRNAARSSRTALGAGRQSIAAPMPGKVIRLLVRPGDMVDMGQGVVVVEAMKMQNEMKATRPGRVAEIRVRDGDTVTAGDTLVVIE